MHRCSSGYEVLASCVDGVWHPTVYEMPMVPSADSQLLESYQGMDVFLKMLHFVAEVMQNVGDNTSKQWFNMGHRKYTLGLDMVLDTKQGLWGRSSIRKEVDHKAHRVTMMDNGVGFEAIVDPTTDTLVVVQVGQGMPSFNKLMTIGGSEKRSSTSLSLTLSREMREDKMAERYLYQQYGQYSETDGPSQEQHVEQGGHYGFGVKQMLMLCVYYQWSFTIVGTFLDDKASVHWSSIEPQLDSMEKLKLGGNVTATCALSSSLLACFSPSLQKLIDRPGGTPLLIHRVHFGTQDQSHLLWKSLLTSYLPIRLASGALHPPPFLPPSTFFPTGQDRFGILDSSSTELHLPRTTYVNNVALYYAHGYSFESKRIECDAVVDGLTAVIYTPNITKYSNQNRGLIRKDPFNKLFNHFLHSFLKEYTDDLIDPWFTKFLQDIIAHQESPWSKYFFRFTQRWSRIKTLASKVVHLERYYIKNNFDLLWKLVESGLVPCPSPCFDNQSPFILWMDFEDQDQGTCHYESKSLAAHVRSSLLHTPIGRCTVIRDHGDLVDFEPRARQFFHLLLQLKEFFTNYRSNLQRCCQAVKDGMELLVWNPIGLEEKASSLDPSLVFNALASVTSYEVDGVACPRDSEDPTTSQDDDKKLLHPFEGFYHFVFLKDNFDFTKVTEVIRLLLKKCVPMFDIVKESILHSHVIQYLNSPTSTIPWPDYLEPLLMAFTNNTLNTRHTLLPSPPPFVLPSTTPASRLLPNIDSFPGSSTTHKRSSTQEDTNSKLKKPKVTVGLSLV